MKTLFDQEREANPNTIILDGGDLIQGSAVAALSEGAAFSSIIKAMKYDFLIPRNWEVVYGKEQMMKVMQGYETPVITANMYHEDGKDPIFPQYYIQDVGNTRLGFLSYNAEVPIRQNPSFSVGLDFDPILENLEALVTEMKVSSSLSRISVSQSSTISEQPCLE